MPTLAVLVERKAHELELCSHALCSIAESMAEVDMVIRLRKLLLAAEPEPPEVCICAGLLLDDGRVIRGHRHDGCMQTLAGMHWTGRVTQEMQGFVTSRNRWVDRSEGARLQNAAHLVSALTKCPIKGVLFSEDLY